MNETKTIDEYPIPFNQNEIIQMQEDAMKGDQPFIRDESNIERTVDGFHDKYIQEMKRTDEWVAFECHWRGCENWYYFWNHQTGYGFKIQGSWEVMCGFVDIMSEFTDEFNSSDFEPSYYPWQLP